MITLNRCDRPIEIGNCVLCGETEGIVIDFSGTKPGVVYIQSTATGHILPVNKDFCITLE